jgi:hypothetical protein
MSVIYCERGGHHVDSDFEEYEVIDGEDVCCECLTDEEYAKINGEDLTVTAREDEAPK